MSADPTAPLSAAAGAATDALGELRRVVPRLVGRTRRQLGFAAAVVERLRCREVDDAPDDDGAVADPASGERPLPAATPDEPAPEDTPSAPDAPAADSLAIPDYDALAASQVLPRLAGLGPAELEAIRAYEAAHRGRRTILARLGQLQS